MQRRNFLAAGAVALMFARIPAEAVTTGDSAESFVNNLGADAIASLTGSSLSTSDRETRFRGLLEAHFDLPGIDKFVLGRYWKIATPKEQTDFQGLFETLLVKSYAKTFAQYAGEKFKVTGARSEDDGSVLVNSSIDRPNGDIIRLDWRIEDQSGTMRITDLYLEGVSLRTTHRSDIASAVQSNGGTVAAMLSALRQTTAQP
jgi:phospholipid transport system substrate-binding protein